MTRILPYDPSFADRVVEGGRKGRTRAQIASDLGASQLDFEAWAEADEDFAAALARADNEARAWLDSQPEQARLNREPFSAAIWARVYAVRYGRPSNSWSPPKQPAAKPEERQPIDILADFDIPDNGRGRRPRRSRGRG